MTELLGNALAHAEMVERKMASINGIISQFESDTRDQALMDNAESSTPAPWTRHEWAKVGTNTSDRQWLKDDLNSWAERVVERAKILEASGASVADAEELQAQTDALGGEFRDSVKRLRELGMRILHLASMMEQQKLSTLEFRKELDNTIVAPMARFSSIVQRGVNATERGVDVPPSEVFRASSLQQQLLGRLEAKLAEREAMIVTLRTEADDHYHSLIRTEEKLRTVAAQLSLKPSQRHRAVDCNIPAPGSEIGVQANFLTIEAQTSPSMAFSPMRTPHGVSRASSVLQPESRATVVSTSATPLSRSGPSPHELLILQRRYDQLRFMHAAMVALFRSAQKRNARPATRTYGVQTSGTMMLSGTTPLARSLTSSAAADSSHLSVNFASEQLIEVVSDEERDRDSLWQNIVGNNALVVDQPASKSSTPRGRLMRNNRNSTISRDSRADHDHLHDSRHVGAIGALVASNHDHAASSRSATRRSVAHSHSPRETSIRVTIPQGPQDEAVQTDVVMIDSSSQTIAAYMTTQPTTSYKDKLTSMNIAKLEQQLAAGDGELKALQAKYAKLQQQLEAALNKQALGPAVIISTPTGSPPNETQMSPKTSLRKPPTEAIVAVHQPSQVKTLTDPEPVAPSSPLPCDHNNMDSNNDVGSDKSPTKERNTEHHQETAPSNIAALAAARRPFSGQSSARAPVPKKYTLLSDKELAHVMDMDTRQQDANSAFFVWKEELQRLRTLDAEDVMSGRLIASSHHFPRTTTPPTEPDTIETKTARNRPISPRAPYSARQNQLHDALPSTSVFTADGVVTAPPIAARPSSSKPTRQRSASRPQPFTVPPLW